MSVHGTACFLWMFNYLPPQALVKALECYGCSDLQHRQDAYSKYGKWRDRYIDLAMFIFILLAPVRAFLLEYN